MNRGNVVEHTKQFVKETAMITTSISTILAMAWLIGDATEFRPILEYEFKQIVDKTEQNTLANARQDYIYLEGKLLRKDKLDIVEKRDFCTLAKILQYPIEKAYNINCTQERDE